MTKHLCGAATDFAITCAVKYSLSTGRKIPDMLLTFCCHHRCTWESYVGKEFFLANNLSAEDFHVMTRISAWYTCREKWHSQHTNQDHQSPNGKPDQLQTECHHIEDKSSLAFSSQRKEEIGKQCKYLINLGRMKYLESFGLKCQVYEYVSSLVTLENAALMAQAM